MIFSRNRKILLFRDKNQPLDISFLYSNTRVMKKYPLFIIGLLAAGLLSAQTTKKTAAKEKPPTQKEMSDMMKEAQKMMGDISPEDKKMMDSMGIKTPDLNQMKKNASGVSDAQLKDAYEDEMRVVPKKDLARIAAIPKGVTDAQTGNYIIAIQQKIKTVLKPTVIAMGDKVYSYIQVNSKNNTEAGNMAMGLWMAGQPELAAYTLGKICSINAGNMDQISNYASMISMLGAQHLAIPLLNNLNAKFPNNSSILNNLGQAWFGLGEIGKADKYLDSAIRIYAYHPQANFTKSLIEESKGNTAKAVECLKKSTQHSYTKEKEERFKKLGDKMGNKDFRLPQPNKADAMNLGEFSSPSFPSSVDECIMLNVQWTDFVGQLDEKIGQLQQQRVSLLETAMKGNEQRLNADINLIKKAQANPTKFKGGNFISVPVYADRAAKLFNAYNDLYKKKLEAFLRKSADLAEGELKSIKEAYDAEMEKLHEEDNEQTGEGKPNKDFCPKYKAATDNYLKATNPKLEEMYHEYLELQKEMLNESAYWYMYIQWPDMFEVMKVDLQVQWLGVLKGGFFHGSYENNYPYVSITKYVCQAPPEGSGSTKLQKFDDVACQYNNTLDLKLMTITNNCSRMESKLDLKFIEYTRFDDFEREEGDTYMGSTLKLSVEKGFDAAKAEAGPLKVEAKVGASVEMEFDREGVKDVILSAEAKVGAGHNTLDKGLEEGGSIGGKDVIDTTVEAGVEGRISLISGHGTVTGTGVLSHVKITSW